MSGFLSYYILFNDVIIDVDTDKNLVSLTQITKL
jgi:hypothetical protein